jgi:hypothetical protein
MVQGGAEGTGGRNAILGLHRACRARYDEEGVARLVSPDSPQSCSESGMMKSGSWHALPMLKILNNMACKDLASFFPAMLVPSLVTAVTKTLPERSSIGGNNFATWGASIINLQHCNNSEIHTANCTRNPSSK